MATPTPPTLETSSPSPPAHGPTPLQQSMAPSNRRVSFVPFSFPASPTAAVSNVAASAANRIAGLGKTITTTVTRRTSMQPQSLSADRGNVETKEPETGDAPGTLPESLGTKPEPTKKVSNLEDENLSKILHRRSRPRSAKLAQLVQEARALQEKKDQST